jgi:hypothetical protein
MAFQVMGGISCEFVSLTRVGNQTSRQASIASDFTGGGESIGLFSWSLMPAGNSSSASDETASQLAGEDTENYDASDPAGVNGYPTCERYEWLENYWLAAARTAMCTAAIFAGLWCAVTTAELAFFRIWNSSTWIVAFSILSGVGTAVSYCVFGSPFCQQQQVNGVVASCALATGGRYTVVSLVLYVVSMVTTACAPKPDPWLVQFRSARHAKVHNSERRRRGRRGTVNEDSVPEGFSTSSGSSVSFGNELDDADVVEC